MEILAKMSAPKFIADRIFSLSKENLSSTVMRLAVTSVALAIIVMLISWAVVVGFKNQIRDKVIGFVAPIHVHAAEGFTTVILLLLFTGSVIMLSLGVIAFYIGKIYDELKGRPRYIISEECGGKHRS